MKLNGEPWIVDKDKTERLPLPPLPPDGYTYAIDGRKPGRRLVETAPAGKCGYSCKECWPYGED